MPSLVQILFSFIHLIQLPVPYWQFKKINPLLSYIIMILVHVIVFPNLSNKTLGTVSLIKFKPNE